MEDGKIRAIPKNLAIAMVSFYRRFVSPLFPPCCRFTPTCSEYALIAFRRYGFRKGGVLVVKRLLKCRPGGSYGYDPVP